MPTMSREHQPDLSPCPAACAWLVEALPHDALYEAVRGLGREIGQLLPGFSLSHRALGRQSVRQLLARGLGHHPRLAGRICLSPAAPWQPWTKVLAMLDETWLRRHWRELLRHYGPPLALALALDERETLRNRGDRVLGLTAFWHPDAPRREALPPGWAELIKLLAPPAAAVAPDATSARRTQELERQTEQSRESTERWKRKCSETETKAAQDQERLREENRQLRRDLRAKDDELATFREQFEGRLRLEVASLRERLLAAPVCPSEPADPTAPSLAEQAERALRRQEALDRQRGTRSELRAELEKLEELEKRLQRSLAESLVLVPGLDETSIRVGQRLREIREALGEMDTDSEAPDLAAALLSRIKNAQLGSEAAAELERLKQILNLDVVRELLGPQVHDRLCQLQRTHTQLAADRLLDTVSPPQPTTLQTEEREVWDLAERLGCYPPATVWLFIDGYNAIRRVGEWARVEQEQGLLAARRLLCDLCRRQAHRFAHVEIVFDGTETTAATESCTGVTVVYSRASGESQNADDHLVQRLHTIHERADVTWLVTDDFGLRERVRASCDAFVPPVLLQRFLLSPTS